MKKTKRGAANGKPAARKPGLAVEITGLVLLFFALFSLISLVSYDSKDPSFASVPPPGHRIHNFAGSVGAYFAEALFWFLGFAAFLLPFGLGYAAVKALLRGTAGGLLRRTGAVLVFFLIFCPLLAILQPTPIAFRGARVQAGGIIGNLLFAFLKRYLSGIGSFVFLLAALGLFLLFSTRWSLGRTLHFFKGTFESTVKEVRIRVTRYRKNKERDKMREKVRQKYTERPEPAAAAGPEPKADRKAERRAEKERKRQEKEAAKAARAAAAAVPPKPPRPPASPPKPQPLLFPDLGKKGEYQFPQFGLLDPGKPAEKIDKDELYDKKRRIEEKLKEFGIEGEVREYHPGPVITTYEFYPAPGIKVAQVANLTEDLSLALEAESVRIQRIPGKSSLGVEIPNNKRETIKLRDIIESEKFLESPSKLTFALGKDVHGGVYITDLAVMPHLLIAGSTGTGKSVALNALIASFLYKATPEEVKLVLIDPKRLEFTLYEDVPHLLCPVINDPKKAHVVLMDIVRKMEERYKKLQSIKVRNIDQYNQQMKQILAEKKGKLTDEERETYQPLPYIVIIIDELAELMMVGAQEVEFFIGRLAQLARAVGIHLVMATQRPSIDVITGTIKNNFSCRVAFRVPSKVDSRIIIDTIGADKLLGMGDMLFLPPNFPRLIRLHCAYISIPEVRRLVKHVKSQGTPTYDDRIVQAVKGGAEQAWEDDGEKDDRYEEAVQLILTTGQASASYLQRRLKLGYARAARIIDQMEQEGLIGASEGSKPREILVDRKTYLKDMEREKAKKDEL
ncbi:MAG TPA: DNA translocase FtsK [Terriglobales bacterium]|nr:DNA translocase FtsK [Terriglobales bacterium]